MFTSEFILLTPLEKPDSLVPVEVELYSYIVLRVTGHKFELLHDLLTFCCNLLNLWFVLDRLMLVYQCICSLWFVLNRLILVYQCIYSWRHANVIACTWLDIALSLDC